MERTAAGQAVTDLILEVFRVNGRLLSAGDALTRPARQTSARWQVLGALDEQPQTVADIGRRMGLTRQSVQRTTDLLEADGLVSYADNPSHQRAKLAGLTPRGRATLDAITTRQIAWANRLGSRLVDEDLQRAISTLQHVRQALKDPAVLADRPAQRSPARRSPRGPGSKLKRLKRRSAS
jgi:DNA-binding MarR family transcriptional regulator